MPTTEDIIDSDQRELEALKKSEGDCAAALRTQKGSAGAMGSADHLKSGPFQKLKRFLAQIAGLQAQEDDLLNQIEKIENKHAQMKEMHLLRKACKPSAPAPATDDAKPKDRNGKGWWGLLAFLAFVADEDKKKNKPEPMA